MSLPMPEFDHLQPCGNCGHPRALHLADGTECRPRVDSFLGPVYGTCECPAYQLQEATL